MTIEIIKFKCPACGQQIGENESIKIESEFNKKIQDSLKDKIKKLNGEHDQEIYNLEETHREQEKEQEKRFNNELHNKVNQQVQLHLIELEKKSDYDKAAIIEKYENEIRRKDEKIKEVQSQSNLILDKSVEKALKDKEEVHREQEKRFELQIARIQKNNIDLEKKVEQLKKTLENIPSEFKGTAGENRLFEDLHKAFPYDVITQNKRGKEMPDVIQTIITEKGEKIDTPIIWDNKTGDNITPTDIKKAKLYKEKYNTDCCIIVSSKVITSKDSKNCTTLIGNRDDVLLVHPTIAVGVGEMTRNFIIEKSRMTKNNNGKSSKQIKLYDYITSPARLRKIEEKMSKRVKLDELQRKEEEYAQNTWKQRKRLIQELFEIDKNDQNATNDITQQESIDGLDDNNDEIS
jgi:hypothetical protein